MIRPRWIILAVLLGSLSFGVVYWWPEGPMWDVTRSPRTSLLGFSQDSRQVYVVDERQPGQFPPSEAYFCVLDVKNGNTLQEIRFPIPEGYVKGKGIGFRICPQGKLLLLQGWTQGTPGFEPMIFHVLDAQTGQTRYGPIRFSPVWDSTPVFSQTGRWIGYVAPGEGFLNTTGITFLNAYTGEKVAHVTNAEGDTIKDFLFSSDDSAGAILSIHDEGEKPSFGNAIRVVELPSGRQRCHFQLPKHDWSSLHRWEGTQLLIRARNAHEPAQDIVSPVYSFDLQSDPVGRETVRHDLEWRKSPGANGVTNWHEFQNGPNWKAEIKSSTAHLDLVQKNWIRFKEWIGLNQKDDEFHVYSAFRFVNTQNNHIYHHSNALADVRLHIAPDGNTYAIKFYHHPSRIALWSAHHPLRWPWALGAGLLVVSLFLLLGRWRYKSKPNPASHSPTGQQP